MKYYIITLYCFLSFNGNGQSKSEIFTYVKNRVETLTYEKDVSLKLSGCQMKYNYLRTLPGNPDWIQERAFLLSDISDVLMVDNNGYHLLILKFTSNDVAITDIEKDGSRNFVNSTNEIQLA